MPDDQLFTWLAQLARTEGAWVVEPRADALARDGYLRNLLGRLRELPARISSPSGESRYKFAERGSEDGRWLFIWIPR